MEKKINKIDFNKMPLRVKALSVYLILIGFINIFFEMDLWLKLILLAIAIFAAVIVVKWRLKYANEHGIEAYPLPQKTIIVAVIATIIFIVYKRMQ